MQNNFQISAQSFIKSIFIKFFEGFFFPVGIKSVEQKICKGIGSGSSIYLQKGLGEGYSGSIAS